MLSSGVRLSSLQTFPLRIDFFPKKSYTYLKK